MEVEAIKDLVMQELADMKAVEVSLLPVSHLTSLADYMVVVSGNSSRHVKAIANAVVQTAKVNKVEVIGLEGDKEAEWVLVDLGDIIVHIMLPQTRDFYQLEKLWSLDDVKDDQTLDKVVADVQAFSE